MLGSLREMFHFYRALFRIIRWFFSRWERVAVIAAVIALGIWRAQGGLDWSISAKGSAGIVLTAIVAILTGVLAGCFAIRLWKTGHYIAGVLLLPVVWATEIGVFLGALNPRHMGGVGLLYGLILATILYRYRREFADRGRLAERRVARILRGFVSRYPDEYRLFNNLLLQDEHHSAEIDHVLISPACVFVIETKSYRNVNIDPDGAWFTGTENERARPVDSPLVQNHGHVKAIKAVLGDDVRCAALVVLTAPHDALRGYVPREVLSIKDLRATLEDVRKQAPRRYDVARIQAMGATLEQTHRPERSARREHVRRARSRQREAHVRFS